MLTCSISSSFLIAEGLRMKTSIIVETGEGELHTCSFSCYGVEAINPYLVFDTIKSLVDESNYKLAQQNFIKASGKALLK